MPEVLVANTKHHVNSNPNPNAPQAFDYSACFLPARRYASAGLCDSDVSVCLSVRRTPVLCLGERKQDREMYTIW